MVVVDDNCRVLQVLPFGQNIGRDQNSEFLGWQNLSTFAITLGAESPREFRRVIDVSGDGSYSGDALALKLLGHIVNRVGKLSKKEDFLMSMLSRNEIVEPRQLRIALGSPLATLFQHAQ